MKKAERAAINAMLESLAPTGVYGLVRTRVDIEMFHPAGGLPIPMGSIESDGRLSIDALAAHVPSKFARIYALDLAALLGCRTTGWRDMVLVDVSGERPHVAPLLVDGGRAWAERLVIHGEWIRSYLQDEAAGRPADGFLLGS
ncbi:hypothetical protein [Rhizorhabdus dicambivorans]|uniref:Uncharacterized protein n=1 Tax=Rhizorhabdus dicambivorans TaxID=1850238 RepID=A0A2A4FWF0_9SPHN|nr:hypothetical protein [Rhizorhabdus dicambivorans]ATE64195.1 hypothetical protein CMV14_07150 [Rhizorhabdus dicambivorans]PCE42533.1 hypothetical protein COO09_08930 [Rhizorhabdus dicambivorans]